MQAKPSLLALNLLFFFMGYSISLFVWLISLFTVGNRSLNILRKSISIHFKPKPRQTAGFASTVIQYLTIFFVIITVSLFFYVVGVVFHSIVSPLETVGGIVSTLWLIIYFSRWRL